MQAVEQTKVTRGPAVIPPTENSLPAENREAPASPEATSVAPTIRHPEMLIGLPRAMQRVTGWVVQGTANLVWKAFQAWPYNGIWQLDHPRTKHLSWACKKDFDELFTSLEPFECVQLVTA